MLWDKPVTRAHHCNSCKPGSRIIGYISWYKPENQENISYIIDPDAVGQTTKNIFLYLKTSSK